MSTWTPVSMQVQITWASQSGEGDDWIDPNLTLLLTEDGVPLLAESGAFLVTEAVSTSIAGTWTMTGSGTGTWAVTGTGSGSWVPA